jgi:hypothetical protein
MSGGTGNTEWAQLLARFHAGHHDATGKRLPYTIVFNRVIESLLANSEVPCEWRILLFIWRMSWGHNSDFAVDRIDGKQIGQNVCADFFGVDKRRVSDAVVLLRGMGYIVPRKGQALYPSDCLPSANPNAEPVSKVQAQRTFWPFWTYGKSGPQRTFVLWRPLRLS